MKILHYLPRIRLIEGGVVRAVLDLCTLLARAGHQVTLAVCDDADAPVEWAEQVAADLADLTNKQTRSVVLGHLQRGGRPIAYDRLIALRFGAAAVRLAADSVYNVMVALDPPTVTAVPLAEATARLKTVPLDSDSILTARQMGVCLGD